VVAERLDRLYHCGRSRHRPWQRLVLHAIPNRPVAESGLISLPATVRLAVHILPMFCTLN
jgi:hypothetical protein